jgi:MFS family permease
MDGAPATSGNAAASVETRASWHTAWFVLAILTIAYGSPLLIVVGLKPIQEALATDRSFVSLVIALVWIGTGLGGILMGWLADRIGIRATVAIGACMTAAGLAIASLGSTWAFFVGHILLGFLGNSAIHPPLLIYISRWFDRRRGTAIALISSGQYFAGIVWPAMFERAISSIGWQTLMTGYGLLVLAIILPATLLLKPVPTAPQYSADVTAPGRRFGGLRPNVVQGLMCAAAFSCCIPMALPQAHLVAFCADVGISPARGATMLSVMLAAAFVARQAWGALADRIGGLGTVLAGSGLQALAIIAFSLTQDEAGLFVVAAAYGLGFAGIIPAYAVAVRDVFPSAEASWRMPLTLFAGMSGMAVGSWFAGLLYDHFGSYAPAFMTGIIFNIANVLLVGFLVLRLPSARDSVR